MESGKLKYYEARRLNFRLSVEPEPGETDMEIESKILEALMKLKLTFGIQRIADTTDTKPE